MLLWDTEACGNDPSVTKLPPSLEPFRKRQKLDVQEMRNSGGELAQLAALSDSINSDEFKLSTAACILKQLVDMPAFCSEGTPPRPFGIYV